MTDMGAVDGVVDACVQPQPRTQDEIREYLPRPFRDRPMPGVFRYLYPAPTGVAPYGTFSTSVSPAAGLPGSDPALAAGDLAAGGVSDAVLVPLTRGQLPNLDLGSALCAATNDWLAATWLGGVHGPVRFHGSIRINPLDVDASIREVHRWAGDDRMVQVAVPLESQLPYGHRVYYPLWEAVAASGLPVAVRSEGYSGAAFHPTPGGFPRHYVEFAALFPQNFVYHLTSLIAEGVFERLPGLRFVFTDGGFDVLTPLMWRMDMDWPITRIEAPWVTKRPMLYLADHVRFVTGTYEGPPDDERALGEWLEMTAAADLLLFGSGYPRWDTTAPGDVLPGLGGTGRERILAGNARSLYGLPEQVGGIPVSWDDVADVVVVGFGAAGVAAALTAARAGADVLVLERQPATAHTPSAKAAAAFVLTVTDVERGARYLDRCASGTTPYAVSRAWAELAAGLDDWLHEACPGITSVPGQGMHGGAAHREFEGADAVRTLQFTLPGAAGRPGVELFEALVLAARRTGRVRIAWSHRGRRLLRDDTGRLAGLECTLADGSVRRIGAGRGVVLTTGGFENDPGLVRQYLRAAPMYFAGNPDNTGDGLRMAQAAGAALWHMNGAEGRQVGRFELGDGRFLSFQMAIPPGGYVVLDRAGRRFCDEHRYTQIHTAWYELLAYDPVSHTYPRIPAYWVFDSRRFDAAPLVSSMIGPVSMGLYTWSADNTAELARGWITTASSGTELGKLLGLARPEAVEETLAAYNAGCVTGDDAFGRPESSLLSLEPPLYAVPLYPGGVGTMGGPQHDEHGRVLDPFGEPIPGLYSAGSVGQMIGDLYPAPGSGWSEALCAGRMAGAAAAAES